MPCAANSPRTRSRKLPCVTDITPTPPGNSTTLATGDAAGWNRIGTVTPGRLCSSTRSSAAARPATATASAASDANSRTMRQDFGTIPSPHEAQRSPILARRAAAGERGGPTLGARRHPAPCSASAARCAIDVGIELLRLGEIAGATAVVAAALPRQAAIVIGGGIVRIERDRSVEIGDRTIVAAEMRLRQAAVVEGERRVGRALDRRVVIGDGALVLSFGGIGQAAVDQKGGVVRLERDGAVVFGDRAVVLALGCIGQTAIVVGGGVLGIEPDRLQVVGDGLLRVMQCGVGAAAVVVGDGEVDRIERLRG